MDIFQIYNDSYDNYSYILEAGKGNVLCIDPFDSDQIIGSTRKKITKILNTHNHFDHTRGNKGLVEKYGAEVLELKDGDIIELSKTENLICLSAPGHTADHKVLIYQLDEVDRAIFSGDTLFNGGVGNCKSGDPKVLFETIKDVICPLVDDVIVYPGHDYLMKNLEFAKSIDPQNSLVIDLLSKEKELIPNIGAEKRMNPFLRVFDLEFLKNSSFSDPLDLFIDLRAKRDRF